MTYRQSLRVDLNESIVEREREISPTIDFTRLNRQSNVIEDGRCWSRGIGKLDPFEFDLATKVDLVEIERTSASSDDLDQSDVPAFLHWSIHCQWSVFDRIDQRNFEQPIQTH